MLRDVSKYVVRTVCPDIPTYARRIYTRSRTSTIDDAESSMHYITVTEAGNKCDVIKSESGVVAFVF
jgi:hypothetical protein